MGKEDEMRVFCQNIRFLREKHHLSQIQMAKRLDISVQSLCMLENDTIPLKLSCDVLFRIHHTFGILPKDMFFHSKNREQEIFIYSMVFECLIVF